MSLDDILEDFYYNDITLDILNKEIFNKTEEARKIISKFSIQEKKEIIIKYTKLEIENNSKKRIDIIKEEKLKYFKEKLDKINNNKYDIYEEIKCYKSINKYSNLNLEYSDEELLNFDILYLYYELYKRDKDSMYSTSDDKILKIYNNEILKEKQYDKYRLLEINENRELIIGHKPYIYDKEIDYTIPIKNVPIGLAKELNLLFKNKKIGQLYFRVNNSGFIKGHRFLIYEELEYGKAFDIDNLKEVLVSKLYDKNYGDCLFINNKMGEITFEELYNKEVEYNDNIVTQVIHFKYENREGEYYITHFDHEFIFYTKESYNKRKYDAKQKGYKKIKSFKADECNIPIEYNCDVSWINQNEEKEERKIPFFYYILLYYFEHEDLLKEYFSDIN